MIEEWKCGFMDEAVKNYMKEIGKYQTFSQEEEVELMKLIEKGKKEKEKENPDQKVIVAGEEARQKMINHNLRLVPYILGKKDINNSSYSDKIQIGSLGLMNAVDTFDYTKGCKFSTYATKLIRQALWNESANLNYQIKIPAPIRRRIKN